MRRAPFLAKNESVEAQTFLYCCAFWTVAADENLNPSEQAWLVEQFGEAGVTKSLDEFVKFESDDFFRAFDTSAKALSPADRASILPRLEEWLHSCAEADDVDSPDRIVVIQKIKSRLDLDRELRSQRSVSSMGTGRLPMRAISGHDGEVTCVAVSPDERLLLSGSEDMTVRAWDPVTGAEQRVFEEHQSGVTGVAFAGPGRILSCDRAGLVILWDLATGDIVWQVQNRRKGGATSIDVASDGRQFVWSSNIGLVRICDMGTGAEIRAFGDRNFGAVHAARFSPDSRMLVTGGDDKRVRLWQVATGTAGLVLKGHSDGVTALAFSPQGDRVVSASRDNTVRLWAVASGKETANLRGHAFMVTAAAFSPDGRMAASGSYDHTVKVWDTAAGHSVATHESFSGRFTSLVFGRDGGRVYCGTSDKSIHVLELQAAGGGAT